MYLLFSSFFSFFSPLGITTQNKYASQRGGLVGYLLNLEMIGKESCLLGPRGSSTLRKNENRVTGASWGFVG
ncbi:hypothetical protein BDZ91DRAFT_724823 [Kalaharituber pfeilii]|nr:hypothetical protein BDZ91DRAFT_724823 [Kalaharituber pfeilii]